MVFAPVVDAEVRKAVRVLYGGAALLFLATVALGIANAFMDEISRAQVLAHFHSGTIGWVTLSILATTLWAYEGRPTPGYRTFATLLAWLGVISVAGYIAAFGLAFGGDAFWLLPLFGIPTAVAILSGLGIALTRARQVLALTTPHLLLMGALIVASLGAVMGVLVGLGYALDGFGGVDVGAHAGPMDMYLALAFAAVVEVLVLPGAVRWRWPGMTQMVMGTLSGVITSFAILLDMIHLAPLAFLLFLGAFGLFLARAGWRAFQHAKDMPGLFWGGLAFPVYVFLFTFLVFAYFIPNNPVPHAVEVTFVHVTFIGMATNLVASIQAGFAGGLDRTGRLGIWVMNIGLLAFIAGEFLAGRPDGALLMAAGVLIVLWRLLPMMWRGAWESR